MSAVATPMPAGAWEESVPEAVKVGALVQAKSGEEPVLAPRARAARAVGPAEGGWEIWALVALAVLKSRDALAGTAASPAHGALVLECLEDLLRLFVEADTEDDELPVPAHVRERARALVLDSSALTARWFRPRLATDGAGGVRMTWSVGSQEIRAVIPAAKSRPCYLYIERGRDHEHILNFNARDVALQIEKLLSESGAS